MPANGRLKTGKFWFAHLQSMNKDFYRAVQKPVFRHFLIHFRF